MPDPIAAMAWGMVWDGNAIPKFLFVFSYLGRQLAETEGFEPSVPYSQYDGLANRWFQPLTHVSAPVLTPLGRCAGIGL
jgi:hypothetical protein